MALYEGPVQSLIDELGRLPGIGPKSAQRIAFYLLKVDALDAKRLAGELGLTNAATLSQTNNFHAWVKLMRDGAPLQPHLIETFPPPFPGLRLEKVIAFTRSTHMMARRPVEERIAASFPKPPKKRSRHGSKRDADRL